MKMMKDGQLVRLDLNEGNAAVKILVQKGYKLLGVQLWSPTEDRVLGEYNGLEFHLIPSLVIDIQSVSNAKDVFNGMNTGIWTPLSHEGLEP